MNFVQHKLPNASKGDVVSITASGFSVANALIGLATDEQCTSSKEAVEGWDTSPVLAFTKQDTATPDTPTVRFTIPSNGNWNIVYSPDQVASVSIH